MAMLPTLDGPALDARALSARFRSEYRRRVAFLTEVFPVEDNPQAVYPPGTVEEFIRDRYRDAPPLHQHLMRELWTLLREIDANGRVVNGHQLYDQQLAHLVWTTLSITNGAASPNSFFLEGAPGTGKTLTLGMIMQACIRLQLRGLMPGKIAYCTAKAYHLASKIRGEAMSRCRVLRAPPYEATPQDINRLRSAFRTIFGSGLIDRYFRKQPWSALFEPRASSISDARDRIKRSLQERELWRDFRAEGPIAEQVLSRLALVLAGRATTVKGPNGQPEILEILPPAEETVDLRAFTGDAAYAIPATDYPVYASSSLGVATADPSDARLALVPARVFTSTQQLNKFRDNLHRHVQVIFCDEAQRRNCLTFQEPVHAAGAAALPLVFAAGSRWYDRDWDCRSPRHSFPEAIRRGVLPNVGVRVFPSARATHYPAETQEAMDQLIAEYFAALALFRELRLPQPHEANTLLVVHGKLTGMVTERLRDEFRRKRQPQAEVWCYTGNDQDREAFQSWFITQRKGPNVLVSSPAIVKDVLDFPSIRQLVVGTRVSADCLYHLIGRLAHARYLVNRNDRVLITLQQFANSNLRATPFHALDHGQTMPSETFLWVNGRVIISPASYERDWKKTRRKERQFGAIWVPVPGQRASDKNAVIDTAEGSFLVPPRKPARVVYPFEQGLPIECEYDPANGPPSRAVVQQWSLACDAGPLFNLYPSIMLVAEEAYNSGHDPRAAVEQKIARLRERASRLESCAVR